MIDQNRFSTFFEKFSRSRIMVVGDIMLDEYLEGSVERISPEAPIPVVNLTNGRKRDVRPGGAANVFNNLLSLACGRVDLCGIIGDDRNGALVQEQVAAAGADTRGLIVDDARPTTIKTRIIAHNQQVVRLDREDSSPISSATRTRLLSHIRSRLDDLDAVIFSDYEKGVITAELLQDLLPALRHHKVVVAVDPKFTNFRHFRDVSVVVPNRKEASGFCRHEIISDEDALKAARYILEQLNSECVLVKLGELGMRLLERDGSTVAIQTAAEQVFDVTGAGDTVISTLVLARTAGATWEEAARIANIAAGIVIHFIGTTSVDAKLLRAAVLHNEFPKP